MCVGCSPDALGRCWRVKDVMSVSPKSELAGDGCDIHDCDGAKPEDQGCKGIIKSSRDEIQEAGKLAKT